MLRIWTIAWREIQQRYRMKSTYFNMFVVPLLIIFILGSSLSGLYGLQTKEKALQQVSVGYVLDSPGDLPYLFDQWMKDEQVQLIARFEERQDLATLRADIRNQKLQYGIVIPSSTDLISGEQLQIQAIRGSDHMSNITMESMTDGFLGVVGVHRVVTTVATSSVAVDGHNQVNSDAASDGTAVQVGTSKMKAVTAMQYYTISMLVMYLLYIGGNFISSLESEHANKTWDRIRSAPTQTYEIVIGKMIGFFMLGMIQASVIITLSAVLYSVDWSGAWVPILVTSALLTICSLFIALLLSGLFKSFQAMYSFLQTLIIAMVAVSGGFAIIPELVNHVGVYTIPYWGMQAMIRAILYGGSAALTTAITNLSLITLVVGLLSFGFYRKAVTR